MDLSPIQHYLLRLELALLPACVYTYIVNVRLGSVPRVDIESNWALGGSIVDARP